MMRYRYGIYAMIVLSLGASLLFFDDLDVGLTVINLLIWPIAIIGTVIVVIRTPRFRRNRRSRRHQVESIRTPLRQTAALRQLECSEAATLIEYRTGS